MAGAVSRLLPRLAACCLAFLSPLVFWAPFEDAFKLPQFALLLVTAAAILPFLGGKPPRAVGAGAAPALAFAFAVALAGQVGGHGRYGETASLVMLALGAAFLGGAREPRPYMGKVAAGMAAAGSLSAVYSIFQFAGLDALSAPGGGAGLRPFSTMGNPDFMAAYLVAVIPLSAAAWVGSRSFLAGAATIVMSAALLLSQSRGAWLGLAGAVAAAPLLLRLAGRSIRPGKAVFAGMAALAMGAAIFFAVHGQARERLSRTFSSGHFDAAGRFFMWKAALDMVRDRPLFGAGPGGFGGMYPEKHAKLLGDNPGFPWFYTENAHNDFLQMPAELGILGAGIWLWALAALVRMSWRRFLEGRTVALGFLLGFVGLSIDALFNFPWSLYPTLVWFWISYAILSSDSCLPLPPPTRGGEGGPAGVRGGEVAKNISLPGKGSRPGSVSMPLIVVFAAFIPLIFLLLRDLQANAWLKLAGDFNASGRWKEGMACAERSAGRWGSWEGKSRAYNAAALAAYNLGDYSRSEALSRRSLEAAPAMPGTLSQLGMTLARAGSLAEAERACRRAVELNPHQADAWHALGNIAWLRRDRRGARENWERALKEDPRLEGARNSLEGLKRVGSR